MLYIYIFRPNLTVTGVGGRRRMDRQEGGKKARGRAGWKVRRCKGDQYKLVGDIAADIRTSKEGRKERGIEAA